MKNLILYSLLALIGTALGGCVRIQKGPALEQHSIHGVIQSLDSTVKTATIKHGEIKGFMGAMTMEFPVKDPAEFAKLRTGETIDGIVFVKEMDFWVGEIKESK